MADIFTPVSLDPLARTPIRAVGSLRLLMASFLAVAAAVHLVMVPSHSGEWLAEGIGFAIVGWAQIALAIAMLRVRRRNLPMAVVIVNIAAAMVWVASRTTGLPFGPNSGQALSVGLIDSVAVIAEVLGSAIAVALMALPERDEQPSTKPTVLNIAIPLAIIALTTGLLASPSARIHGHDTKVSTLVEAATDSDAPSAVSEQVSPTTARP